MSGSVAAISVPPPPPPVDTNVNVASFDAALTTASTSQPAELSSAAQTLVDNYTSSISASGITGPAADAAIQRATDFIRVADSTAGVNLADGLSGDEYLLASQAISNDAGLSQQFRTLDEAVGSLRSEYFGQYGIQDRNLLDAAGNVAISVDDAANQFNDATGNEAAEAAGAEEAGGTEEAGSEEEAGEAGEAGSEEEAGEAEESEASEANDSGGGSGGDIMSSLWPFLMGLLDENNDGEISPEEFAKGMRKLDTNGDGKLSKDEMVAGGMSEEQADKMMTAMDANGDDAITLDGSESELDTFVTEANADGNDIISETELGELIEPATETSDTSTELALADM
ncbi:MAG: EF-hand domain-containing protein [Bosea sp. (in: a-proteobacteria)]